jgi:hypothetical protein
MRWKATTYFSWYVEPRTTGAKYMNVTVITQPAHPLRNTYRPRFNWKPLTDAIASSEVGTWLSVPMAELPDDETHRIQTGIYACAGRGGSKVQTQINGDSMLIFIGAETKVNK